MVEHSRSATELVHQVVTDLRPLTEVLSPQDHSILTEFSEYALEDQSAIVNTASLLPLESTLLIVLLEEHKRTQRLYDDLSTEIERLKMVAQRLQEIMPLEEAGL